MAEQNLVPVERIEHAILAIRGHKVLLDADLAALYGVDTKTLNRAVKRNLERFPADFMFQLNDDEAHGLRYQFGTLKTGRGQHRKYLATLSPSRVSPCSPPSCVAPARSR
jgi:hypothetical protein